MAPALRADQIPVGAYARAKTATLHADEVRLTCPVDGCEWTTIRPEKYAWSADEGHRLAHQRGIR